MVLEAGDFIFIPAATVHVIANPSEDEEAVLVFCYIGVGNTNAAGNVWLDEN
jgi:quercetin dioxygenase-like cupin family protein